MFEQIDHIVYNNDVVLFMKGIKSMPQCGFSSKVAGALIGGGAGAALSRGDGRWWAIPLGAVVGSAIGCDAAGG